uniref:Sulfotransferase family protein n=1 Tax=Candidatus Kentrum sp. FM TaxID=2126340 RepID=A0A450S3L4_9GAMM|nr:MAG: Sulfotransferase family protein [Candidatus Kentron sp. FM]VFJ49545.1 MAG: Sulfotransferase family protein [Candidatus Kentron sp. FM]VFK07283.1 MAG: Sulfotransferase family protein [Candidatus Kentron sp. FM]
MSIDKSLIAHNPVFILASERSGTNLLRRRLTESQSTVFGPAPIHILKHLHYAEPYYGKLEDDVNFYALIDDALSLVYKHFSPWDISLSREQVLNAYTTIFPRRRCVIGVMHVLYTMYARCKGYNTYLCKDNNLFDFACEIHQKLPDARFIYLYRDPRDVVLSQLKRPTQVKNIHYLAQLWKEEQIKCIHAHAELEGVHLSKSISYETLISDEERTIRNLCQWLNLEVTNKPRTAFQENIDIHEWKNLDSPTIKNNKDKYMTEFSQGDIAKIEACVWYQMKWLGFTPIHASRPEYFRLKKYGEIITAKFLHYVKGKFGRNYLTDGQLTRSEALTAIRKKWT